MSREELQALELVALEFHLLVCERDASKCPRCRAALLAKEMRLSQEQLRTNVHEVRA